MWLVALCLFSMSSRVDAQIPNFKDESGVRLLGLPANDTAEKDIAIGDLDRHHSDPDYGKYPDIIVVRKQPFNGQTPMNGLLLMNDEMG